MSRTERSVLGAILLDSQVYKQAAELQIEDFSLDSHRRIFARMVDLDTSGRPVDILSLVEELERHSELEAVGGAGYIAGLVDGVPDQPSIEYYVRMVRDGAARRRAAKLTEKAQQLADDPSVPTAALAEIGNNLSEIAAGIESLPPRFSEEALALRFSRKYADELRYVARWGHWMRWNATRWVEDDTLHVFTSLAASAAQRAPNAVTRGERPERSWRRRLRPLQSSGLLRLIAAMLLPSGNGTPIAGC